MKILMQKEITGLVEIVYLENANRQCTCIFLFYKSIILFILRHPDNEDNLNDIYIILHITLKQL